MKITKFGTISENPEGGLTFDGFETDPDGDNGWRLEVFVECVIERLRKAIAEMTTPVLPACGFEGVHDASLSTQSATPEVPCATAQWRPRG